MWAGLTVTAKFYFTCLLVATGYSVALLVRAYTRVCRHSNEGSASDLSDLRRNFAEGSNRIENLRQFHSLLFFLFGIVLTNEVYACVRAILDSRMSLSALGLEVFSSAIAFAFCTLTTFAFLHSLQWFVAARLQSYAIGNLRQLDN